MLRRTISSPRPPVHRPLLLLFLLLLLFHLSCTSDNYDTGDGTFSYLMGEFGEIYTGGDAQITRFVNDSGETITFAQPYKCDWVTTPDSVYRSYVQYDGKADDGGRYKAFAISQVAVLHPRDAEEINDDIKTDPIGWESLWASPNLRYLNLALRVKLGGEQQPLQRVGVVCTQTTDRDDGTREYQLRLYHDQNGVLQYYTSTAYVSIPLEGLNSGDELVLTVLTYEGDVTRRFTMN